MNCIDKFIEIKNKINELDSAVMEAEARVMELRAKEMALVAREKVLMSKSLTAGAVEELQEIKKDQKALAEEIREAEANKTEAEYLSMSLSRSLISSFGRSIEDERGSRVPTEYSHELQAEFTKKVNPKVSRLCRLFAEIGQAYDDIEAVKAEYEEITRDINTLLGEKCNGVGAYSSDFFNAGNEIKAKYLDIVPAKTRNFINHLNAPLYRY